MLLHPREYSRRIRVILAFCAMLGLAAPAFAANVSWTGGAGTSSWGTGGNWSTGEIPDSSSDVFISTQGLSYYPVTSDSCTVGSITVSATGASLTLGADLTCNSLTISAGTVTIGGSALQVLGSVTIASGATLDASTDGSTVSVDGDWANSGAFTCGTSMVQFTNSSTASLVSGTTTFHNLVCTTPGKTIAFAAGTTQTVGGSLVVQGSAGSLVSLSSTGAWNLNNTGSANVSYASVSYSTASAAITAYTSRNGGNTTGWTFYASTVTWTGASSTVWSVSGNWNQGYVPNATDNVVIASAANQPILSAATTTNNLTIGSGASLRTASNALTVNGTFANNGGTLYRAGTETVAIATMGTDTGTVVYNGAAGGTIQEYPSAANDYYNLTINGTGIFSLGADTAIANALTITAGTLSAGAYGISVGGSWTKAAAAGFGSTGTVTFTGTGTITGETSFNNLAIGASASTTLAAAITVTGNLSIGGGAMLAAAGYGISVAGNWSSSGTFTPGSNTVTFAGTATATISGSTTFSGFTCTAAGKTISFTAGTTQTVSGALTITGTSSAMITLTGTGAWTLDNSGNAESVSYASVYYGQVLSNDITAASSCNAGNNDDTTSPRWEFSASTVTWTGASGTGWSTAGNWSPPYVPNATDNVVIPYTTNKPVMSANVTVNNLTIGNTGTNLGTLTTSGYSLSINGTFGSTGVLYRTGAATESVSKTDTDSGLTVYTAGTVQDYGTGADYYDLEISGTVVLGTSGCTVVRYLTIDSSCSLDTVGYTLSVGGTFSNNGILYRLGGDTVTLTAGMDTDSGTVTYRAAGGIIQDYGATDYYNLTIDGSGYSYSLGADLTVAYSLTITAGTFLGGTRTITTRNWSRTGTFTQGSGTVVLSGAGTVSGSSTTFNNLTRTGTGTTTASAAVSVDSDLTLSSGTLTMGAGYALTVTNDLALTAGTLNLGSASTVGGDVTISSGATLAGSSYQLSVGGNWASSGTYSHAAAGGTIRFTGDGTISAGGTSFYNLIKFTSSTTTATSTPVTVANSLTVTSGTLSLGASLTVTGSVTISAGGTLAGSSYTISVGGSWLNSGGYTYATGGTVAFTGTTAATIGGTTAFNNLTCSGLSGAKTITMAVGTTQTVNGSFTIVGTAPSGGTSARFITLTSTGTWYLDNVGNAATVQYAAIAYSELYSNSITTTNTRNLGNNDNASAEPHWIFGTSELTWTGTSGTNWSTATNWTLGFVPTSVDNVTIPTTPAGVATNFPYMSAASAVNNLTIESGASVHTNGNTLTINGTFANYGTLYRTGQASAAANQVVCTMDTSTAHDGTVVYTGGGVIQDYGATDYCNLRVATTGTTAVTYTMSDDLTTAGTLAIDAYVTLATGSHGLTQTSGFVNNGTLSRSGSHTVYRTYTTAGTTVYSSDGGTIQNYGGTDYYALEINGSGLSFAPDNDIGVASDLTITAGELSAGTYAISVAGNWSLVGTFTCGTGSVAFTGSSCVVSGATAFHDLAIGSGATLTVGSTAIDIGGDWTNAGTATSFSSTGTVTFTGTGSVTGETTFYDLATSGTGTTTLAAAITVANDLAIGAGTTLTANGNGITVGENWSKADTASFSSTGTVTFDTLAKTTIISGSTTFSGFSCVTAGKTIQITAGSTQTVTGALAITGGSGSLISLESTSSGTTASDQWTIVNSGTAAVSYAKVTSGTVDDTSSGGGISADYSRNGGNNDDSQTGTTPRWVFTPRSVTWNGDSSTSWDDDANWSIGYVPNKTDNVTIASTTSTNYPILGVATTVNSLTINNGTSVTTAGCTLTISGTFTNNGTLYRTGQASVGVTDDQVVCTMDTGAGTVVYQGAGGYVQDYGTGSDYSTLTIGGTGTFTLGADLTTASGLNITGALSSGSYTVTVTGTFNNTGTVYRTCAGTVPVDTDSGTVVYQGAGGTIRDYGTSDYYNLIISGSGQTYLLGANLRVVGSLTISAGILDVTSSSWPVSVGASWTNSVGSSGFLERSGTVTFTGTGTINSAETFYDLAISGTGATTLGASVTVGNDLAIASGGTLVGTGYTLTVTGDWTNAGTFTPGSSAASIVAFAGAGQINSGGTFYNLTKSGTGTTTTLYTGITVSGSLTLASGTLGGSSYTIYLAGSWLNTGGSFSCSTSTVIFTGAPTTVISGSNEFFNFTCTAAGKAIQFTAGTEQTVTGTLTITGASGSLVSLTSTSSGLTSADQWTIYNSGSTVENVTYALIRDSVVNDSSRGIITAVNSRNEGNNDVSGTRYWSFDNTNTVTWSATATTTAWNTSSNWTKGYVPNTTDNVVIQSSSNYPTLGAATTVNSLTINSGTSVTTGGYTLTISSTLTNRGTLYRTGQASTSTADDQVVCTMDTSTTNGGTVVYQGTGGYVQDYGTGNDYCNLTFGGTGAFTLNANLATAGALSITGALDSSSYTVTVTGTFNNTGTLFRTCAGTVPVDADSGTVVYQGASGTIADYGSADYNNLELNGSGYTYSLGADCAVAGSLTIVAGTLDVTSSNRAISVAGSWNNSVGTTGFAEQSGTVTFTGTGTIQSAETFHDLTKSTAGTTTLAAAITVGGDLAITAGILDVGTASNSYAISVSGSWTNSVGTIGFTERSGTVTFAGDGTIQSAETFYNLEKSGSGTTTVLGAAITVNGGLSITAGTLDVGTASNSYAISVSGGWSRTTGASFTCRTGTVTFTGSGAISNAETFYDVTISAGARTTATGFTATNALGISGGSLTANTAGTVSAASLSLTGGDMTVTSPAALSVSGAGSIASSGSVLSGTGGVTVEGGLSISAGSYSGSGAVSITGGLSMSGGTYSGSGSASVSDGVAISGGTYSGSTGTLTVSTGNVAISAAGVFSPSSNVTITVGNLTVASGTTSNSVPTGTMTISAGGLSVSGGTLSPSNTVTLTAGDLTVSGGTLQGAGGMTVGGSVSLTGGTFYGLGRTVHVAGGWTESAGVFVYGTSTVDFNGSGTSAVSATNSFYDFTVAGAAVTLSTAIVVVHTLAISSGSLDVTLNNRAISVGANWNNAVGTAASFNQRSGTVTFTGTGTIQSAETFYNLTKSGSGTTTTLDAAITVDGGVTISAGYLDVSTSNYGITVVGGWNNSGGTFTYRSGTVTFTGSGAISNAETFNAVTISGGARTTTAGFTTKSGLDITGGTLSGTGSVTVETALSISGGSYAGSGAVTVTGALSVSGGSYSGSLSLTAKNGIAISGTGVFSPSGVVSVSGGDMTVASGTTSTSTPTAVITLSGADSDIAVSGGTLVLEGVTQLTGATGDVVVSGGTLTVNAMVTVTLGGVSVSSGTLTAGAGISVVAGAVTLTGGVFNGGSQTISAGGDWNENAAVFSCGTSTVDITGTSTVTAVSSFHNFSVIGGSAILASAIDVANDLVISSGGSLDASSVPYNISVGANWNGTGGTFVEETGTVTFADSGTIQSGETFYNLTKQGSGTTTTLGASVVVSNDLTISSGVLDVGDYNFTLTVGGDWNNTVGSAAFTERKGIVIFSGNGTITNAETFYNLTKQGSGTTTFLGANVTVTSAVKISSGAIDVGASATSYSLSVGGNWSNTVGTDGFVEDAGTVYFTGNGTIQTSETFSALAKTTGGTTQLGADITVTGSLSITGGVLDVSSSSYGIWVGADWTNDVGATAFTERSGTVHFTGTGVINSAETFYSLTKETGGTTSLGANVTVGANVAITGGTLDISGYTLSVANNWNRSAGTFTGGSAGSPGTVDFTGAGTIETDETFYTLRKSTAGTTYLGSAATVSVGAGLTVSGGTLNTNARPLIIAGAVSITGGTFNATSSTVTVGTNWNRSSGTFTAGTSTVEFTATGAIQSAETFSTLSKTTGGTTSLGANVAAGANVAITGGTLDISGYTLSVANNWSRSAGTFTGGSAGSPGTVIFTATGEIQTSETFYNLSKSGSSTTTSLASGVTVTASNALTTVSSATLDADGQALTVNGSATNAGTIAVGSGGTFTAGDSPSDAFTNSSGGTLRLAGGTALFNAAFTAASGSTVICTYDSGEWLRFRADVTWAGTLTQASGSRVRFDYGAPASFSVSLTGVTLYDVYLDLPAAYALTLGTNLTCRQFVFFRGILNLDGRTLATTASSGGDFVVFGANYQPDDLDVSGTDTLFAYPGKSGLAYDPYTADPYSYSASFTGLAGSMISVGASFYVNGADMSGSADWTLTLPTNTGSTPPWGTPYAKAFSMTVTHGATTNANAPIAASSSVTGTPTEYNNAVVDGGDNSAMWGFTRPAIASAQTVYDNVMRIVFNHAVTNSGGAIASALSGIFLGSGATPCTGGGVYTTPDCTTGTELVSGTSYSTIYLKAPTTWNTDATGTSAGASGSTNRSGTHSTVIPDIQMAKGVLYDTFKNPIRAYSSSFPYTGTTDACRPVLLSITAARESTGTTSSYDGHNGFTLAYSEPMVFGYGGTDVLSTMATAQPYARSTQDFTGSYLWGGDLTAASGTATLLGYFSYTGAIERGATDAASGNSSANALYQPDSFTLKVWIAGYATGSASAWSWPGYVSGVTSPVGQAATVISSSSITDAAGNVVEPSAYEYDGSTAAPRTVTISGTAWDVTPPDFVALATAPYSSIVTVDSNSNSLIDRFDVMVSEAIRDATLTATAATGFSEEKSGTTPPVSTYNSGFQTWVNNKLHDSKTDADDEYFALLMTDSGYSWSPTTAMYMIYDSSVGHITDLAGNLLVSYTVSAPLYCIDPTPPVMGISLAAVGGKTVYVRFSKDVKAKTGSVDRRIAASDFVLSGFASSPTVSALQPATSWDGNNVRDVLLTLSWVDASITGLSAEDVLGGAIAVNASAVYDGFDNVMDATVTRSISDIGLGIVEPVWAKDSVHGGLLSQGVLRKFDGTGRLLDSDITLEMAIDAGSLAGGTMQTFYDVNPSVSSVVGSLWLPAIKDELVPTADTAARGLVATESPSTTLRDFTIPGSDSEIVSGVTLQFVVKMGGLWCARLTDPDDPRTVAPWSISISSGTTQRGGVTILNNVINPATGDKTAVTCSFAASGSVSIIVFTLSGDVVKVLTRGAIGAGDYTYSWDGKNAGGKTVARGIYFVRVVGPGVDETRKVLVVR